MTRWKVCVFFGLFFLQTILTAAQAEFLPNLTTEDLPRVRLRAGEDVAVNLITELRDGAKITNEAPTRFKVAVGQSGTKAEDEVKINAAHTTIVLPLPSEPGQSFIKATAVLYYCKSGNTSLCYLKSVIFNQPLELVAAGAGPNQINLNVVLQ